MIHNKKLSRENNALNKKSTSSEGSRKTTEECQEDRRRTGYLKKRKGQINMEAQKNS